MPNTKSSNLKKTSSNAKEDVCISLVGPAGCGKSGISNYPTNQRFKTNYSIFFLITTNKALLVKYLTKRFIGEYDPYYGKLYGFVFFIFS